MSTSNKLGKRLLGSVLVLSLLGLGCASGGKAGWNTRLVQAPLSVRQEPPPPQKVVWIRVNSVNIPNKTPGGLAWDDGDDADPQVVMTIDGEKTLSFEAENNLKPNWQQEPGGNFDLNGVHEVMLQMHDTDGLTNKLIGRIKLPLGRLPSSGEISLQARPTGRIKLQIEPAHALIGLGFDYRMRPGAVLVTEILQHSPASRSGLKAGDKFVSLGGKPVDQLSPADVKSILNTITNKGLQVVIIHSSNGNSETVTLREGPIYALHSQYGVLP